MLVEEEIIRSSEGTMNADRRYSDQEGRYEYRSNAGEEDDCDCGEDKGPESFEVRERSAEEDERSIDWTEEVEEEPRSGEADEEDEREWMGEKRESEDQRYDADVIRPEIRGILPESRRCLRKRVRLGEGGSIEELGPWTATGQTITDRFGEAVHKCTDGWRLRFG